MRDARTGWTIWQSRFGRLVMHASDKGMPLAQPASVDVRFRRVKGAMYLRPAPIPDEKPWDEVRRAADSLAPLMGWRIDCRHAPAVMELIKLAAGNSATMRAVARAQAGKLAREIKDGRD